MSTLPSALICRETYSAILPSPILAARWAAYDLRGMLNEPWHKPRRWTDWLGLSVRSRSAWTRSGDALVPAVVDILLASPGVTISDFAQRSPK